MKKKILLSLALSLLLVCFFVISISAGAPAKPELDVSFGDVSTIDGFVAPSELFVDTDERVLLVDENGNYVTYPTYYVTKNQTTFDFDFSKLNEAQTIQYTKKSVVMLEIPEGIIAISGSYFAGTGNFPLCVSVQFPGTVTTYGAGLFGGYNSVIKVVEFLDGKEPITMGDGMFGSQWNGGATNIQYVKFPNNLVSIGNNTFGKAYASKVVILGENLESIGTGFFGESTPDNKDTFLYVSDKFFADKTKVFANLFGSYAHYHGNKLKLTVFYTGTQSDAEELVAACKKVQSGYVFDNAKYVSSAEYDDTKKASSANSIVFVYDYSPCDAFHNGTHKGGLAASFEGEQFLSDYVLESGCTRCGDTVEVDRLAPLFVNKGYSYFGTSILQEFAVNRDLIDEYKSYFGDIKFGVVAATVQSDGLIMNVDGTAINEKVKYVEYTEKEFDIFAMKVNGIGEDAYADTPIYVCAYLIYNGEVKYISNGKALTSADSICYNDLKPVEQ